jgi:hypothetical protein
MGTKVKTVAWLRFLCDLLFDFIRMIRLIRGPAKRGYEGTLTPGHLPERRGGCGGMQRTN